MTSTIKIIRTTLEGVERVMRRRQWIAVIGFALIGGECRALAIRPHDAVAVLHFGNRERAALRHGEARSSFTDFRHETLRDRGIFIPHSRSPRMVNVELKRYSGISVHGWSATIVTQAAGPACDGDREVLGQKRAALFRSTRVSVWTLTMTQDEYHMSAEIDVTSLATCQVSPEGDYVSLSFEDALGRAVTLRLTPACVQELTMTLPDLLSKALQARYGDRSLRAVFPLGDWRLEAAAGSNYLILTMMTPDGF